MRALLILATLCIILSLTTALLSQRQLDKAANDAVDRLLAEFASESELEQQLLQGQEIDDIAPGHQRVKRQVFGESGAVLNEHPQNKTQPELRRTVKAKILRMKYEMKKLNQRIQQSYS